MRNYNGIDELVEMINDCPQGCGAYYQVFYNRETDEVWGNFEVSLGENSWSVYDDRNIVCIGNFSRPTDVETMRNRIDYVLSF